MLTVLGVVLLLAAGEPATIFAHKNLGHEEVRALAFDKSGATLATARHGGIELVDVAAGATRLTISGPGSRSVTSLAFSPDGALLASGGPGNVVALWDAKSGALVRKLLGHSEGVTSVGFSPDGKKIISADFGGTVRVFEVGTGAPGLTFVPLKPGVVTMRALFSSDGTLIATAGGDKRGTIGLFSAADGSPVRQLQGHQRAVWNLAWVPGGKRLISASGDTTARLWDAQTGETTRSFAGHRDRIRALAISPDGKLLATAGGDPKNQSDFLVRLWNVETGEQLAGFFGNISVVSGLEFSPDGKTLASAAELDGANLWDVTAYASTLPPVASVAQGAGPALRPELVVQGGHSDKIHRVALSADGQRLATAGDDRTIKVWELRTGKELRTVTGFEAPVYSVGFSRDGTRVYGATYDDKIRSWEVETGVEGKALLGDPPFAVSPDGALLLTAVPLTPGKFPRKMGVRLLRLPDGAEVASFLEPGEGDKDASAVAFSADGARAAIGIGGQTRIIDVRAGRIVQTLRQKSEVGSVAFQPHGALVATAPKGDGDGVLRLFGGAGEELHTIQAAAAEGYIYDLHFSPDGATLAASVSDKSVNELRFYEVASGKLLRAARLPDVGESFAYSPDGQTVASGSWDKSIALWDGPTAQLLRTLGRTAGEVRAAAFSPTAPLLAEVTDDDYLRLWDFRTGRALHATKVAPGAQALAFDHEGRTLYVAHRPGNGREASISRRDLSTGAAVGKALPGDLFAQNSDGTLLAAAASGSKEVAVFDASGAQVHRIDALDPVRALAFDNSGLFLAVGGEPAARPTSFKIRVFLARTGSKLFEAEHRAEERGNASMAWAPGSSIASGRPGSIQLWDPGAKAPVTIRRGRYQNADLLAFSPDRKLLATAGMDGVIPGLWLFDAATGKEVAQLKGHTDFIVSLSFSTDGRYLASAGRDGAVKLWDVATRSERATLVALGAGDQIIATPEGYFAATKGAFRGVGFRLGGRSFPSEQFDLKLNRPDLVLARVGYGDKAIIEAYRRAFAKRLENLGMTEASLGEGFQVPTLRLVNRDVALSTEETSVKLTVEAADLGPGLARLHLSVNDVPQFGSKGLELAGAPKAERRELEVKLSRGRNKIKVWVQSKSSAESLAETIEVVRKAPPALPDLYVLAIGVSRYRDAEANLQYAAKDATDLVALLKQQQGRFGAVNVLQIVDGEATREAILKGRDFLARGKVDDQVIVFFAGHGMLDAKLDYYFATTDIDFASPAARGLSYGDLESLLDGLSARKKLLLIDSCNSGEVDKSAVSVIAAASAAGGPVKARAVRGVKTVRKDSALGLSASFELQRDLFADLRRGSGAIVIASASGVEYALESDQFRNGVFTYSVLEGLRTMAADADKNGRVSVSELRDYVIDKVVALTAGGQTPTSRRDNVEFDFDVY